MTNQPPKPWFQFVHLFHHDPMLNKLPTECNAIIQTFCKHVLLMTHDAVCKNGARAPVLIDGKPWCTHLGILVGGIIALRGSHIW